LKLFEANLLEDLKFKPDRWVMTFNTKYLMGLHHPAADQAVIGAEW
jgi:hypothetical protein